MTPDDLAAIRARVHRDEAEFFTESARDESVLMACWRDRRALLAEVDRLTAELAEAWQTPGTLVGIRADERARIRAAVEGLPSAMQSHPMERVVNRAAVLAAIDGETRKPLGGIEQFQDEDR